MIREIEKIKMKKLAFCTLFDPDDRSAWGGKHYLMLKALEEHFDVSVISSLNDNPAIAKITNKYFRAFNTDNDQATEIRSCLEHLGMFFRDRISKDNSDFLFFPNNLCVAYVDTVKPTILSVDSLTNSDLSDNNLLNTRYPALFLEILSMIFKRNIHIQFPTVHETFPFTGSIEKEWLLESGLENDAALNQLIEKQIIKKFSENELVLAPDLESKKENMRLLLKDKFDAVWVFLKKMEVNQRLQESNNSNLYGLAYGPINANKLSKEETLLVRRNYSQNICRLLLVGTDWKVDGGEKAYQIMLDLNRMGLPCELAVCGCVPPSDVRHPMMRVIKSTKADRNCSALDEEYRKASFFLALTARVNFSHAVAQAASWGLPVLGINRGNLRFMVKGGVNGYLFDIEDHPSVYAERICRIYKDKTTYFNLCQGTYERYSRFLSWDQWGDQTSRVFRSLKSKGNKPADTKNIIYDYKNNGQFVPFYKNIEIDVTYRCNLGCFNCDRSCGVAPSTEDITIEQIKNFIAESKTSNHIWSQIRLIGGEPTLHPRILEIFDLFVAYKKEFPQTEIFLATNGCGNFVQEVLEKIPLEIHILNTKKTSKVQEFVPMNVAPADAGMRVGSNPGCSIMRCGIGLNTYGYYHCSVAGSIDRVFKYNIGRKKLPLKTDDMLKERLLLCRMCGFQIQNAKKVTKQVTSSSWKKVLKEYQTVKGKLTLY